MGLVRSLSAPDFAYFRARQAPMHTTVSTSGASKLASGTDAQVCLRGNELTPVAC